jgi:glycosyltransferase involved in cell wall biosynthesis
MAVDAVGIKHSGGATVLQEFLKAAIDDDRLTQITVFCSPRVSRNFALPESQKITEIELPNVESSRFSRLRWFERQLPLRAKQSGADVLVCMSGSGRAPRGMPQVTFVQQSLPFYREARSRLALSGKLKMGVISWMTERACRFSQTVLVQTPAMRQCIVVTFGIPSERVQAILPSISTLPSGNGASTQLKMMRETPPGRRLLYVGNQSPYKNVAVIAESMGRIRARLPEATLFLTWPDDHELTKVEGIRGCGYLNGGSLREAYELATVLVLPSLAETVGLPMLEAMSVGTPVLVADRSYAHDICEDAAVFFDPLNGEDFAEKAIDLLSSPARLDELSARGKLLIERRTANKPYQRMIDAVVESASWRGPRIRGEVHD